MPIKKFLPLLWALTACQTALPNTPVQSPTPVASAASGLTLSLPLGAYKQAYQGFYPDDQLRFRVFEKSTEAPQVFEQPLDPRALPETLRLFLPLQTGQRYRFELQLNSRQMACAGPILDGELLLRAGQTHQTWESPALEVSSERPADGSSPDRRPLSGWVRNAQGQPMEGVAVKLMLPASAQTTTTDARGWFVWGQVPLGVTIQVSITPPKGTPQTQTLVLRRRDDSGALRGICDPSLNQLEFVVP